MIDASQKQLITQTARDLVARLAPEEMPRFRAASQAYFEDPARLLDRQANADEALGFGTGIELVFLTPVVLSVITQVVNFLAEQLSKSIQAGGTAAVTEAVRSTFKLFSDRSAAHGAPAHGLTIEELTQVRKVAFAEARRLSLSESRASLLADSVAGCLATASS